MMTVYISSANNGVALVPARVDEEQCKTLLLKRRAYRRNSMNLINAVTSRHSALSKFASVNARYDATFSLLVLYFQIPFTATSSHCETFIRKSCEALKHKAMLIF